MGSALRLPIATAGLDDVLSAARAAGVGLVATVPRTGRPMFEADLRGPIALLLGGEGPGLPASLVEAADERVSIPMREPVESLNVAVAAALLVYEAGRQREGR
jgi:TrmH family RNA methyltransferase